MTESYFEETFLVELNRHEGIVKDLTYRSIQTHPDAYPFVLKMLNSVLQAGIEANTIGGSEPEMLMEIAYAIKETLRRKDSLSEKFITVV